MTEQKKPATVEQVTEAISKTVEPMSTREALNFLTEILDWLEGRVEALEDESEDETEE
jgi:hypothetical protein